LVVAVAVGIREMMLRVADLVVVDLEQMPLLL
jgi:hypothetical protein